MMRLHQVHVRVTPRLRRGVAGASTTSITQVIATMVRVTSMVIPERNAEEFLYRHLISLASFQNFIELPT